jgi:hypothetical protein
VPHDHQWPKHRIEGESGNGLYTDRCAGLDELLQLEADQFRRRGILPDRGSDRRDRRSQFGFVGHPGHDAACLRLVGQLG